MPVIEPTIDDIAMDAFSPEGVFEYRFECHIPEVELATANCRAERLSPFLSYWAAARLCAATRDLFSWYIKIWHADESVERFIPTLAPLLDHAVDALRFTLSNRGITNTHHLEHIEKMIQNTANRREILEILDLDIPHAEKFEKMMHQYNTLIIHSQDLCPG